MNFAWVRPMLIRGGQQIVKHAPHLLMGMGTVSGITALVMAVQATTPAHEAIVSAKIDKGEAILDGEREGVVEQDPEKEGAYLMPDLTFGETVKAAGKFYIPAIGMELFSLLCFWSAHGIDMKRQAILAGLYSTAEQALIEYQAKVKELMGEKAEKEIRNAVAQDHIDRNPPPAGLIGTDTDEWCQYNGYRFRCSYNKLKEINNDANAEMIHNLYLSESDLLWMFDPDHRWIVPDHDSYHIGWSVDKLIEFDILPGMTPDHKLMMTIEIRDKDGHEYLPQPGFSAALH